jgi:Co/Zn/Cd efflux system component
MDCPSEERLIRTALDGAPNVYAVECDLATRTVRVTHAAADDEVASRLAALGLGATLTDTSEVAEVSLPPGADPVQEARTLRTLLVINAAMFAVELTVSWVARSAGLLADSLDMFADAAVYGVALYAVGRSASAKLRTARFSGWLQGALAIAALAEVVRRATAGGEPYTPLMIAMATLALAANVTCLWLVSRHRAGGAHMKASVIFSANDVLANLGVIAAGVLVAVTGSQAPDLVIGAVIALLVLSGAYRILRLR